MYHVCMHDYNYEVYYIVHCVYVYASVHVYVHCNYKCLIFLQFPRVADNESAFVKGTNNYSNTRNLVKHDSSEQHQICLEAKIVREAPEKAPLTRTVTRLTRRRNDTMLKLFRTAYFLVKQNLSLRSYDSLVSLQECNGLQLGRSY